MKPLKNANLKKRVMTALVSATTMAGTVAVVAPDASAATAADSYITVSAYKPLPDSDLHSFLQEQQRISHLRDASTNLLPTEYGPGWCIDWGLSNPWDNISAGYEVRQLTGQSGRYGTGDGIAEEVRYAAINVVKKLTEDWNAYKSGDASKVTDINKKNLVLRALLGNDLSALNTARGAIYYGTPEASDPGNLNPVSVSQIEFQALTGFTLKHVQVQKGSGSSNYALIPDQNIINKFKQQYTNGEYVTIIVPKNYNYTMTRQRNVTFQRIVPIEQPGINPPKEPWDGQTVTETEWSTPPATKTTETITLPPRTVTETVTQPAETHTTVSTRPRQTVTTTNVFPPKTVSSTVVKPGTTVTKTTTLPVSSQTTYVTEPVRTTTRTVTPDPVTTTVKTTENGTPVTKTVTTTPEPHVTTETTKDKPTTVTETITAETKTIVQEPTTVTETRETTPVKTTVKTLPATTVTETKTVTPAPVSVTETVVHNENYYREKLYERVKEVREYHHYAGFINGEKSKEIELPEGIGSSWTFEIIKGRDIVTVERTEEGKLKISPKPGFKGEGDVEILITDDKGNQHIYRVKVSDKINVKTSTKVKVNNFFYTIDPAGDNRVRIIEKNKKESYDWYFVDEDGNRVTPKPGTVEVVDDEGGVKVEIKDPSVRGNVVVRVTEESGDVRENIVTIENTTKEFDVTRELLNTSTAIIERRGGDYTITNGEDLVTVEQSEDGKDWIVKPNQGATGTVEIVFTEENGVEHKYTLEIIEDPNGDPVNRIDDIAFEDSSYAEFQQGWTYEIIDNTDSTGQNELADITKDGDRVTVTPKSENGGTVVLRLKNKDGGVIGTWTVNIAPARDWSGKLQNEDRERELTDRSEFYILRGWAGNEENGIPANKLEIVEGQELLSDESETPEDGNFVLHFKPGAEGTIKVVEKQAFVNNKGEIDYAPVTTYIGTVKPSPAREVNYHITADNGLNLRGTNLKIVEGEELIALGKDETLPEEGVDKLNFDLRRDAEGKVVIENSTEDGYVFERYTINVTPGRQASVEPIKRQITWNGSAKVNFNEVKDYPDTEKFTEGGNLVTTKVEDGYLVLTPKKDEEGKDQTGTVKFEVEDKRGVWAKYEIEIVEPKINSHEVYVSTNGYFWATMVDQEKSFRLIKGNEFFKAPEIDGNQWILKPKADAAGKTGTVVEYDSDNNEINRYTLIVTQGEVTAVREQRDFLIEDKDRAFKPMSEENTFVVVSGNEFVETKTENGQFVLTGKSGSAGELVRVEERNSNGDLVRTLLLTVLPEDMVTAEGLPTAHNKDLPAVINNGTVTGEISIVYPDGVTGLNVTEGGDKVIVEEGIVTDKDGNTGKGATIKVKEGATGPVKFIFTDEGGNQAYLEQKFNIRIKGEDQTTTQSGSSELDGKCIAGIVGLTAPLLLAIPLGILSQVQIPGLEGVSAQVNAAIRQANDQIQRGLGIYDEDRASRAAGLQAAFSIENPQALGLAAGALGAITLGLLAVDGVMRACGAEEYTSSYMFGKAIDNETLMNGSSGSSQKSTEEKAASSEK